MEPVFPLSQAQIDAANRLYARLPEWQASVKVLERLRTDRASLDDAWALLLKAATLDCLYGTYLRWRVVAMARRVGEVLREVGRKATFDSAGPSFVECLAKLPDDSTGRGFYYGAVFASKFAHFFIDEQFPVLDKYAEQMLCRHWGETKDPPNDPGRYKAFVERFQTLRQTSNISPDNREMDHYLWLGGQYCSSLRGAKPRPNKEVRSLFETTNTEVLADLNALLPAQLRAVCEKNA